MEDFYHGFFDSPEYQAQHTTNQQFITQLYACTLFRGPDPRGFAGWSNILRQGYSRSQVLDGFLYSPEFTSRIRPTLASLLTAQIPALPSSQQQLVNTLYGCVLNRQADANGSAWVAYLSTNGASIETLYHGFFDSSEYANRGGNTYGLIADLYRCVLYRSPSPAEVNAWQQLLDQGMPISQLVDGFLYSPEYKANIAPSLNTLLTPPVNPIPVYQQPSDNQYDNGQYGDDQYEQPEPTINWRGERDYSF